MRLAHRRNLWSFGSRGLNGRRLVGSSFGYGLHGLWQTGLAGAHGPHGREHRLEASLTSLQLSLPQSEWTRRRAGNSVGLEVSGSVGAEVGSSVAAEAGDSVGA